MTELPKATSSEWATPITLWEVTIRFPSKIEREPYKLYVSAVNWRQAAGIALATVKSPCELIDCLPIGVIDE